MTGTVAVVVVGGDCGDDGAVGAVAVLVLAQPKRAKNQKETTHSTQQSMSMPMKRTRGKVVMMATRQICALKSSNPAEIVP